MNGIASWLTPVAKLLSEQKLKEKKENIGRKSVTKVKDAICGVSRLQIETANIKVTITIPTILNRNNIFNIESINYLNHFHCSKA